MYQTTQPSKERIRQWLADRQRNPGPLPTIEQIKSELGWQRQDTRAQGIKLPAKTKLF